MPKQREIVPKPQGKGRGRGRVLLDDDSITEQPEPFKPFTTTQLEQLKQEAGLSYNQFNINLTTADVYAAVNWMTELVLHTQTNQKLLLVYI